MAKDKSRRGNNTGAELVAIRSGNGRLQSKPAKYHPGNAPTCVPEGALGLSLEQVAEILAGAGDAILVVDLSGTVIYVNKKVEEVYGNRDVLGKRFIDVDIFGTDSLQEKEVWFHDLSALMQQENPPLAEVLFNDTATTEIYTE